MANFTALAAARHAVLARGRLGRGGAGPVRRAAGHRGRRRRGAPVGCSRRSACSGSGASAWCACRWTGRARMRADALPALSGPTIVCLQAGNVNTGAFDPFAEICEPGPRGRRLGARGRRLRPVGRGRAVARAPGARRSAPPTRGPPTRTSGSTCPTTAASPSCATPSRCARPWASPPRTCPTSRARARGAARPSCRAARAAWRSGRRCARSGRAGLADLVERNCRHAARFADGLRAAGYEVLNDVVLNQVLVSFGDDASARAASSPPSRPTAPAGAAAPSGRATRRCASASRPGRRPRTTWSAASRR